MKPNDQNPDIEKAHEYQEIQERATESGHLRGINTHVSTDAGQVMDETRNTPPMGKRDNSTPGLGVGVNGTGVMGIEQKDMASNNPEDDCGCGDVDQKTINDALEEVGD